MRRVAEVLGVARGEPEHLGQPLEAALVAVGGTGDVPYHRTPAVGQDLRRLDLHLRGWCGNVAPREERILHPGPHRGVDGPTEQALLVDVREAVPVEPDGRFAVDVVRNLVSKRVDVLRIALPRHRPVDPPIVHDEGARSGFTDGIGEPSAQHEAALSRPPAVRLPARIVPVGLLGQIHATGLTKGLCAESALASGVNTEIVDVDDLRPVVPGQLLQQRPEIVQIRRVRTHREDVEVGLLLVHPCLPSELDGPVGVLVVALGVILRVHIDGKGDPRLGAVRLECLEQIAAVQAGGVRRDPGRIVGVPLVAEHPDPERVGLAPHGHRHDLLRIDRRALEIEVGRFDSNPQRGSQCVSSLRPVHGSVPPSDVGEP